VVIDMTRRPIATDAPSDGWVRLDTAVQRFCPRCGTPVGGANFCPRCGLATENGGGHGSDIGRMPRQPQTRAGHGRQRWRLFIAGVAAVLAIGLAAGLFLVLRPRAPGSTYVTRAGPVLASVIQQNRQLAGSLGRLSARGNPAQAAGSVQATVMVARSAQRSLTRLTPSPADRAFAARAQAALAGELAWLTAAASLLKNPASPIVTQLDSLGAEARSKLRAIDPQVRGASASLPGSAKLVGYAQERRRAVGTTSALRRFSDQVRALLTQSGPAFTQINQLFGQMQIAASGGTPTITLAQAEAMLTAVISNRTSLAASARALDAPTPTAATVRADLVAAMDASLTNDQDISTCLNQANTGTVAYIFQSCLSSTSAHSTAATNAKQQFLAAYNALRRQIGQRAISVQF
jgi:hypothetical protein